MSTCLPRQKRNPELRNSDVAPDDWELCLEIISEKLCLYYVVSWHNRCLAWLEECSTEFMEFDCVVSGEHLRVSFILLQLTLTNVAAETHLRTHFWKHVE